MTPGIPSPRIPKVQARNISPARSIRQESPERTVSALTSLVLADRFQDNGQKENRVESTENKHGSPGKKPCHLLLHALLMSGIVKTIHQLKEGLKALSDKLHHSRNEHETSTLAAPVPLKDALVKVALISESPDHADPADQSISQLESWSDDGSPQQADSQSILGMLSLLE
jgi:hypothetical protein